MGPTADLKELSGRAVRAELPIWGGTGPNTVPLRTDLDHASAGILNTSQGRSGEGSSSCMKSFSRQIINPGWTGRHQRLAPTKYEVSQRLNGEEPGGGPRGRCFG